ncbi:MULTISPECIES: MlaD family protein [Asaia]|uniref:Mce/MlaD domain-containing protein n=2 Tax=Asaia bogorensis TaxID=91915 RepID=A0AAN4R034_9PROT|nr:MULTISPECIES: MlaD family protein [Asaia]ETC97627.1 paraquat-inducible protein B [Asaia sp. SF2.1]MDL2170419.1 MlaD family protein [Asaia sp. HumB]CDG41157.1 Paraquat-inducible protein B [Asaia bogorensis]BAT20434.1 paraquat-inducible protein B [Asaia bogorensis NBRC 16594]GBQ79331.1 paraquat-inducible protein B [Asaia bogorensis NBRC 16594]
MNRQALVGAFVLGGMALMVAAFVFFGNFHPFTHTDRAVLIFRGSTNGLSVGAPVNFRGVQVGAVDRIAIEYDPKNREAYIPVYVTLRRDDILVAGQKHGHLPSLKSLVDHGLRGEMNLKSFVTGTSQIDLDISPDTPAILHPELTNETEIPTRQSSIQAITNTITHLPLRKLSDDAAATIAIMHHLAEMLDERLPALADNLQQTSQSTRATLDAAHDMITAVQPQLLRTLASVDRLATTGSDQLTARGQELRLLLQNSRETMVTANKTLSNLQGMTSPRSIDRANLDASLRDIASAAAALRGFANDVERNPQLLLTGRRQ